MKRFASFFLIFLIITSCTNELEQREKELQLKEKELELKERELQLQNNQGPAQPATPVVKKKTEKVLKEDLGKTEALNPEKYFVPNLSFRVNLIGNTIIEGTVKNTATLTTFKNLKLKASFYSKTDVLLGEQTFTIMEFFPPNKSITVRHKINGSWDKANTMRIVILDAQNK